jgi:hypothetical protein
MTFHLIVFQLFVKQPKTIEALLRVRTLRSGFNVFELKSRCSGKAHLVQDAAEMWDGTARASAARCSGVGKMEQIRVEVAQNQP